MPAYRIRYVCESSLRFDRDVALNRGENEVVFLFSQKAESQSTVRVRLVVEGTNYQDADIKAQPILMPALDAMSFSTGSPLLVLHWDFIIKDEAGSRSRRAIWCDKRRELVGVPLTELSINEAERIFGDDHKSAVPLSWHRYALQRNLILDRFLFQWLAFEGLSGKRQIPTICPTCRREVHHCEKPLLHEGSDREKGYSLFSQVEAGCSEAEFKREIWGKARNQVFHGTKSPSPALLGQLRSLSPKLREACDREFARQYGIGNRPRPHQDIELHVYRYNMFEWQTANAENRFADDFPWDAVQREFGNMEPNEARMGFPDTWPFRRLDFNVESPNW